MGVRIFEIDNAETIANKIFFEFDVMQSTTVRGLFVEDMKVIAKGERVLDCLRVLDKKHNMRAAGGRMVRKRHKPANSIGGYAAEKIFKYKIESNKKDVEVAIWRIQ